MSTRSDRSPSSALTSILLGSTLLLAGAGLSGCGNTITNTDGSASLTSGPSVGAKVTVSYEESATSITTVSGTVVGLGTDWIGVERAPGAISWMPADRVRFILEDRGDS